MIPRVAFFTDSFHEVNGVALTSRKLDEYAQQHGYPFLSMHFGPEARDWRQGEYRRVEYRRSEARMDLDRDLSFDFLIQRHRADMLRRLKEFGADVVHVTGPGDAGILGAWLAHEARLPLVLSWHTNVHEYAGRRLRRTLGGGRSGWVNQTVSWAEQLALAATCRFYKLGTVLLAPSPELCDMLQARTSRPVHLMPRGSDPVLFSPAKRRRMPGDGDVVIGFVGRLSTEKNVRLLARMEAALAGRFGDRCRFLIVGDGSERAWLEANLKRAHFAGVLRGEELAQAYADMDVFAFPSETDTYGNVVVEALASGVPAVVTASGGPKYLVRDGLTGFASADEESFTANVAALVADDELRRSMGHAARAHAESMSWERVFDGVWQAYEEAVQEQRLMRAPGLAA